MTDANASPCTCETADWCYVHQPLEIVQKKREMYHRKLSEHLRLFEQLARAFRDGKAVEMRRLDSDVPWTVMTKDSPIDFSLYEYRLRDETWTWQGVVIAANGDIGFTSGKVIVPNLSITFDAAGRPVAVHLLGAEK